MRSPRSRSIPPLVCLFLVVQSLWPVGSFETLIAWICLPARLIAELAAPLEWMEEGVVFASDEELDARADRQLARLDELDALLRASAYPGHVSLGTGVRRVHAEVVGREARQRDRVRLRVEDPRGLEIGLPVVYGDGFVGTISQLPGHGSRGAELAPNELVCDLVTGKHARVIGKLLPDDGEPQSRLVVGGLAPSADEVLLDIHSPTWREPSRGLVVVDEENEPGEGRVALANGFYLGELSRHGTGQVQEPEASYFIRPLLDYAAGLHQVLILAPGADLPRAESAAVDPLADGGWRTTRPLSSGDPDPRREALRLRLGSVAGVREGTAVARGRDLVGRIGRVEPFTATVRGLGDPGLSFSAVALVRTPDGERPHVLGLLTARGRRPDGTLLFEWPATVPLDVEDGPLALEAEIWTGSGEPGVPLGLSVGRTLLPRGPGPHALVVVPPKSLAGEPLRVRMPDRAVLEGLEGGTE